MNLFHSVLKFAFLLLLFFSDDLSLKANYGQSVPCESGDGLSNSSELRGTLYLGFVM